MTNLRKQAFALGFITKIAESKIDPLNLNDSAELTKIAIAPVVAAGTLGLGLPLILNTLINMGVKLPHEAGAYIGNAAAEGEAEFDPNLDSLERERIIREYERQIDRLKSKKNNQAVREAKLTA